MKILFITSRYPFPLEKGDKLRAFNQIKELGKSHQVLLFSVTESPVLKEWSDVLANHLYAQRFTELKPIRKGLNFLRGLFNQLPFQVNYFFYKSAQRKLNRFILKYQPDVIFCQLVRMGEYARHLHYPKAIDYMDAFSMGILRRKNNAPFYAAPLFDIEYRRLRNYELQIFNDFKRGMIISQPDKVALGLVDKENIVVVPNGVNLEYYFPKPEIKKTCDLIFTGNMSYAPNISAVLFLHQEVLPILQKQIPNIKIVIAGANPTSRIMSLHSENFKITGWVEHMNDCYAASRIFIAPMQIGTGLQNKLLEAMAMGLPCITSSLANDSLNAKPDKEILIADTPKQYVEHIVSLLNNPELAAEIAEHGRAFVKQNFDWARNNELIEKVLNQCIKDYHQSTTD